jgi:PAS domain S-box-containing protein
MPTRSHDAMSKAELLEELRRLQALISEDASLVRTVHELEVQREELRQQQVELIESQRLLELSRDRYADLFDFAPIGYALLDQNGVVKNVNLVGARLLRTERSRIIDLPLLTFVVDRERRTFLEYMAACRRRSTDAVEADLTLQPRSGPAIPVHLTGKRMLAPAEPPLFHVAIADVSERKRLEDEQRDLRHHEELARAASEAKDHFIAVLSHELRTPLTPILLALASLASAGAIPAPLVPTIDMIRRNIELEARLIDDLLDVTRIVQGRLRLELTAVDAHAIMEEVAGSCAEETRIAGLCVSLDLAAPEHHVRADATRLRQVVWNLVRNALRYTPSGGGLHLQSANPSPGRLTLSVSDTGPGIPPAMVGKLFHRFERGIREPGRNAGMGLGLAICKGIVEALGGGITVENRPPGEGARVVVELATVPAPRAQVPTKHESAARQGSGKRVLVVEDDRDNAEAISALLRLHGYEVEVADTVAAALTKAREGVDIVVSDIGLPDGTGRDLLRQLGPIRSIALTGYGTDEDVTRNAEAGFARHLTKPVDPDALLKAVSELAESADGGEATRGSSSPRRSH